MGRTTYAKAQRQGIAVVILSGSKELSQRMSCEKVTRGRSKR